LKKLQLQQPTIEKALSTFRAPWLIAYRYLGARTQIILPYFEGLTSTLQKAALKISLQSYVSLMAFFAAIAMVAGFTVPAIVIGLAGSPPLLVILFSIGVGVAYGGMLIGILVFMPWLLARSRASRMERELPYVASHLSILASAGMPPTRMFKLLGDSRTTPEVASDSNEIVRDVEILGNDIMTALEIERERSPSKTFGDVLEGLVATIRSGGSMKAYLVDATHTIMDIRRIALKQLIETLGAFAEVYVTLMIVFPLLIIVMFSVMALIGGGLGGLSVTTMMIFVTYGIIPVCGLAVIVMLDSTVGED
jgi:flagellar protein FlaJ